MILPLMMLYFILINIKFHVSSNKIDTGQDMFFKLLNEGINNGSDISNGDNFITNDEFQDYYEFLDKIIDPETNNNVNFNVKTKDLQITEPINDFIEEFYRNINNYIRKNVTQTHHKTYFHRLDTIKGTLKYIGEYEIENEEIFSKEIDQDYSSILNHLKNLFSSCKSINYKTSFKFSFELDKKMIKIEKNDFVRYSLLGSKIQNRPYVHLREFMKLYKYVKIFPELLVLGYACTQFYFQTLTIYIHLITLFLTQNEENLLENRMIVLLLIKTVFSHSSKHRLDLISIFKFQDSISTEISRLYFFCCEFNNNQRRKIKIIMNNAIYLKKHFSEDRVHFDIVLKLYFYQHLIYIKYINVKYSEFEEFKNFTNRILSEKNGCVLNQFFQFIDMF